MMTQPSICLPFSWALATPTPLHNCAPLQHMEGKQENRFQSGYWSVKVLFCSGSRTSRRAAAGSPCKLFCWREREKERDRERVGINSMVGLFQRAGLTSLSTSSSRKTGLFTPIVFNPWMILPGMEPIYVRLQGKKQTNNHCHLNPIPVLFSILNFRLEVHCNKIKPWEMRLSNLIGQVILTWEKPT